MTAPAKKPRILFVCTGNIFRSLSAEFGMRAADERGAYHFSSAGTATTYARRVRGDVLAAITANGADAAAHKSRPLDAAIVAESDLIVAMDRDHQRFIRDTFNRHAPLFLDISRGQDAGIPDLPDVVPDYKTNPEASALFVRRTVDFIMGEKPGFMANLPRFLPSAANPVAKPPRQG